jgi:osmotically-inducible protein OsmY
MTDTALPTLDRVRDALAAEQRLGPGHPPIQADEAPDGTVRLTGEVPRVAMKRIAAGTARRVAGDRPVDDQVRVTPGEPRDDAKIRDAALRAFQEEAAFHRLTLGLAGPDDYTVVADPPDSLGRIDIGVRDGVVTLDGSVPGLAYKRLAGVLAWWVPGCTAVVDRLAVDPPDEDSEAGLTDAVRAALEKDPLIDAAQIRVVTRGRTVLLEGWVKTETERAIAEADTWYVFGVEDVADRIEVGH